MTDEKNACTRADQATSDAAASGQTASEFAKSRKRRKVGVIVGVVAIVLVAAGAGFWVWHEQPSFCNAICHSPMDPYLQMWESEPERQGVDKYGNSVENSSAMLAIAHKYVGDEGGMTCLGCHEPTLQEQMSEGLLWATGGYVFPLEERSTDELMRWHMQDGDEFCLNEACHNMSHTDLVAATADLGEYNPHAAVHGEYECGDCHKAHRASVNYCSQCHEEAPIPDGWMTWHESEKLPGVEL